MDPEQLSLLLQEISSQASRRMLWEALGLFLAAGVAAYAGSYLRQKAISTATKEDIAEITRKIESVKLEISEHDRTSTKKYELKFSALLDMLNILDAHISHKVTKNDDGEKIEVDLQYASAEEARRCHNAVLLSVDDMNIPRLLLDILCGDSENFMEDLNELRRLTRAELGFGTDLHADAKRTWLAWAPSKKRG